MVIDEDEARRRACDAVAALLTKPNRSVEDTRLMMSKLTYGVDRGEMDEQSGQNVYNVLSELLILAGSMAEKAASETSRDDVLDAILRRRAGEQGPGIVPPV